MATYDSNGNVGTIDTSVDTNDINAQLEQMRQDTIRALHPFSLADPDNVYAMVQRMREIGFKPSTSIGVRPPNSHWTTPPSYFVEIPNK